MAKRTHPKRSYPRMARVNELLREVLAEALVEMDDDRLVDVTITNVTAETDIGSAVVHFDVLGGADADDEVLEAFEEIRSRLQSTINRETHLKQTPRLTFAPDPVVRSAARIEDVLRGLRGSEADGPGGDAAGGGPAGGGAAGTDAG